MKLYKLLWAEEVGTQPGEAHLPPKFCQILWEQVPLLGYNAHTIKFTILNLQHCDIRYSHNVVQTSSVSSFKRFVL